MLSSSNIKLLLCIMKLLLLLVVCLAGVAIAKPASTKYKRDILPGDPRYGTDYHHKHHHVHKIEETSGVEHSQPSQQSFNSFSSSYVVPNPNTFQGALNAPVGHANYGPPNYTPGKPIGSESHFTAAAQVSQYVPQIVQIPSFTQLSSDEIKPVEHVETVSSSYVAPIVEVTQAPVVQYQPVVHHQQHHQHQQQHQNVDSSNQYLAPAQQQQSIAQKPVEQTHQNLDNSYLSSIPVYQSPVPVAQQEEHTEVKAQTSFVQEAENDIIPSLSIREAAEDITETTEEHEEIVSQVIPEQVHFEAETPVETASKSVEAHVLHVHDEIQQEVQQEVQHEEVHFAQPIVEQQIHRQVQEQHVEPVVQQQVQHHVQHEVQQQIKPVIQQEVQYRVQHVVQQQKQAQPAPVQQVQSVKQVQPAVQEYVQPAFQRHAQPTLKHYVVPAVQQQAQSTVQHFAQPAAQKQVQHAVQHYVQAAPQKQVQPAVQHYVQPAVQHYVQPAVQKQVQPAVQHYVQAAAQQQVQPALQHYVQPAVHHYVQPAVQKQVQPALQHYVQPAVQKQVQPAVPHYVQHQFQPQVEKTYVSTINSGLAPNQPCQNPVHFVNDDVHNFDNLNSGFHTFDTITNFDTNAPSIASQVYNSDFTNLGFGFQQDSNQFQGSYSTGSVQQENILQIPQIRIPEVSTTFSQAPQSVHHVHVSEQQSFDTPQISQFPSFQQQVQQIAHQQSQPSVQGHRQVTNINNSNNNHKAQAQSQSNAHFNSQPSQLIGSNGGYVY